MIQISIRKEGMEHHSTFPMHYEEDIPLYEE